MSDSYTVRIRGSQAQMELRETGDAFDRLRQALIDKLLSSPAEATQTREKLYFAVQSLDVVKQALKAVIESAEIEKQIEAQKQAAKMVQRGDPDAPFSRPIRGADGETAPWPTLVGVGRKPAED